MHAFHDQHERIYTIKDENDTVEFTTWKVRAIGSTGGANRGGLAIASQKAKPRAKAWRQVYLGKKFHDVPVYNGEKFGAGTSIAGPAIIEQPTTTILLLERQIAKVDDFGNLMVDLL